MGDTVRVLPLALLVAATTADALPARTLWYDCLDGYAQTEMLTAKTPASIALAGTAACAKERDEFRLAFYRQQRAAGAPPDGPSLMRAMAAEDQAAARHVIAVVTRNR